MPVYVRDLMSAELITVAPEDSVTHLYDLLDTHHIRHMPVVDEHGCLVGLVSHRDLVATALGELQDLPVTAQRNVLDAVRVADVMREDVETAGPELELRDAAYTLLEHKFGCLPVVEGDLLVGILTEADFVRKVAEDLE